MSGTKKQDRKDCNNKMPKSQLEIAGMERPKIKAIEEAAEAYIEVKDKLKKIKEQEADAKATLIEAMLRNQDKLSVDGDSNYVYRFADELVVLSEKAQIKVRAASEPEGDDE